MNPLIREKHDELVKLCRRFLVRQLELFGSAAVERFDPQTSDLDFLVDFEELIAGEYFNAYFGLLEGLQELFQRPVDLVVAAGVRNPYFLAEVGKTRTLLYAA